MLRSLIILFVSHTLWSAQVVTDKQNYCKSITLHKELRVYKDPYMFLSHVALLAVDPIRGWKSLAEDSPLLGTFRGTAHFMELGDPKPFGMFLRLEPLVDLYTQWEPKLLDKSKRKSSNVVQIQMCGNAGAYADTLGFVLVSDLEEAQIRKAESGLAPSIFPNEVPKWKE